MGSWLDQRRLSQTASRLRALREELARADEQMRSLADEAEDLALRALVAETPGTSYESNHAQKHAETLRRHRDHVASQIAELEARQDALLDKLSERRA